MDWEAECKELDATLFWLSPEQTEKRIRNRHPELARRAEVLAIERRAIERHLSRVANLRFQKMIGK